jgi:hypothetical protein
MFKLLTPILIQKLAYIRLRPFLNPHQAAALAAWLENFKFSIPCQLSESE